MTVYTSAHTGSEIKVAITNARKGISTLGSFIALRSGFSSSGGITLLSDSRLTGKTVHSV